MNRLKVSLPSTCLLTLLFLASAFASQNQLGASSDQFPLVELKTESIAVVKIEEQHNSYLLHLKNTSSKDIIALSVYFLNQLGRAGNIQYGKMCCKPFDVLIPAGEVLKTYVGFRKPGMVHPQGKENEQAKIVIEGIAFRDQTYEGEINAAVYAFPLRSGYTMQSKEVLHLLNRARQSREGGDAQVLEWLKQQVSALRERDIPSANEFEKLFPSLTENDRISIQIGMAHGLHSVKSGILDSIKRFEKEHAEKGEGLQNWLTKRIAFYEEIVSNLQKH